MKEEFMGIEYEIIEINMTWNERPMPFASGKIFLSEIDKTIQDKYDIKIYGWDKGLPVSATTKGMCREKIHAIITDIVEFYKLDSQRFVQSEKEFNSIQCFQGEELSPVIVEQVAFCHLAKQF